MKVLKITFFALLLFCGMKLYAQTDTNSNTKSYPIAYIGDLNFDCVPDTLKVQRFNYIYLPTYIAWGKDSVNCYIGSIPDSVKVRGTRIIYPRMDNVYGTYSIINFNSNDTIPDILFFIKGIVRDSTDTSYFNRTFVIFGQPDLDTLRELKLSYVDSTQRFKFQLMNVDSNHGFSSPAVRSSMNNLSYIMTQVNLNVNPQPAPTKTNQTVVLSDIAPSGFKYYPNPSTNSISIELSGLSPSEYTISILTMEGNMILTTSAFPESSGIIKKDINVSSLASGNYTILVKKSNYVVYSTLIVVVH